MILYRFFTLTLTPSRERKIKDCGFHRGKEGDFYTESSAGAETMARAPSSSSQRINRKPLN
ncbi:MAG TPA: hypothetical protein VLA94_00375, partial [Syntrophales bacterium]|nr:hypothetical protein [Syntrophales bacterium]